MTEQELRAALRQAATDRAHIYLHVYRELAARSGKGEAASVLSAALRRCGRVLGKPLRRYAPADLSGLCDAFAYAPDGGEMFAPAVLRCDGESLQLEMTRCPLKEAWQEAGVTDEELATLTRVASELDVGTITEAGFAVEIRTWQSGDSGCCRLNITPLKAHARAAQDE
jgi:hypothetical protein